MSERLSAYAELGVSADKKGVHAAIQHLSKGLYANSFAKVLPDLIAGDAAYCNIIHADTAGTKAALAYMYAKETGDLSVLRELAINPIQMNLGDLACIGAVGQEAIVLSNTIGRNARTVSDEYVQHLIAGTEEHLETLRALGIHVVSGGGETADVGDIVRTIDIGHTAFVRMPREKIITVDIKEGDAVVGLASSGQTTYETAYNSGLGSNGYTLARHGVLDHKYATLYPETLAPELPESAAYRGSLSLQDRYEGLPENVGKSLLSPTRAYLPVLQRILANREGIHGIIHCTGGGQSKVNHFLPDGIQVIKDNLLAVPPVFRMIQEQSRVSWQEMFQVFNCGHMMELYVSPDRIEGILEAARAFHMDAAQVGICRASDTPGVIVQHEGQEYAYPKRG